MTAVVLQGNARSLPLADNTVDLIISSPPYFALRSYQDGGQHYAGQIGSEPTPTEFVDALGRHGITLDMSADYCRLAAWRTSDPRQLARAARKPWTPPREQVNGQLDLLEGLT